MTQKFRIISDLHADMWRPGVFEPLTTLLEDLLPFSEEDKDSVLLIAGDLCSLQKDYFKAKYEALIAKLSSRFKEVLWIPGNHEFYNCDFSTAVKDVQDVLMSFPNVTLSENINKEYDNVSVHGCTLWTNFLSGNFAALECAWRNMNDYRYISKGKEVLSPNDTMSKHFVDLVNLDKALSDSTKEHKIVFTHHAPSEKCIDPKYATALLNSSYYSNLHEFINKHNPDFWIHGHTHCVHNFNLGNTRVMCNPMGYHKRENTGYSPSLFIEIK